MSFLAELTGLRVALRPHAQLRAPDTKPVGLGRALLEVPRWPWSALTPILAGAGVDSSNPIAGQFPFGPTMSLPRHPDVQLDASKLIHSGFVFDLHQESLRLPSGLVQHMEVIEHPGAVAVVAENEDGELLLVRQYRHALGAWLLELPAGRLEAGEDPLDAARRELEEETGFTAESWQPLREIIPAPGFCSEVIHVFLARGLHAVPGGGLAADDDEEIEVCWRRPEEVLGSELRDAKTLLGAALVLRQRG